MDIDKIIEEDKKETFATLWPILLWLKLNKHEFNKRELKKILKEFNEVLETLHED